MEAVELRPSVSPVKGGYVPRHRLLLLGKVNCRAAGRPSSERRLCDDPFRRSVDVAMTSHEVHAIRSRKFFPDGFFTLRARYPYLGEPLPSRHPWGPVPSAAKVKPPAIFKQAIERNSDGSRF